MKKILNTRLWFVSGLFLILAVLTYTIWLYNQMERLAQEYSRISQEKYQILYHLKSAEKLVIDMETGIQGYMLTGDTRFLEPYTEAKKEIASHLEELFHLFPLGIKYQNHFQEIMQALEKWTALVAVPIIQSLPSAKDRANNTAILEQGKRIMDQIRDRFDLLETLVDITRQQDLKALLAFHRRLVWQVMVAMIGLWLLIAFMGYALYRQVRRVEKQNIELLEKEEKLRKAVRELYAASQMKSEFLANMSHELRTPLNAIIGFAQVLKGQYYGALNEKQSTYVNYILTSGQHLLSLINDVLDLSKIEAGKLELELSTFSLRKLLENSLIMVKEKAAKHNLKLSLEIEPDLPDITADERKLKQIMYNLLSNAVKFTPDGGSITIRARRFKEIGETAEKIEVSVADTGIGIAPEDQERIFEPFTQARMREESVEGNTPYVRQHEGTGLGLALVRRLVELHGGRVWVESPGLGRGSTFYFTLPVMTQGRGGTDEAQDSGSRGQ
ncbi:Signal transduction histidine kinase [Thermanaeromonas toyohensis ToBE]|uniref:Circadian input-output histidine kinase CikA n=1 Tax=Thermanaeromonas toyohensis ToBE TaxID=698762 RepID=A0A1W1V8W9_9FIRM|nr:ATP-binding protein [Thermanaeromonas toyohensis]SMB89650.1 Signal transduction histidine kinase [Thermanaeromonas toyohensis ToBE]